MSPWTSAQWLAIAERKIAEAAAKGEFDDCPARESRWTLMAKGTKKLSLLNRQIEAKYFRKVVRKLGG